MATNIKEVFFNPFSKNNPVIVQVLGICSVLAVTAKLEPALVMGISVTAVLAFANVIISLIRNTIPTNIRIIVQLVVVATLVIIVDQVLKAYNYQVSKQLSVFIGLIITNCILMGRLEAFALGNKPWPAFLDGIGNGIGYAIILVIVGFFRELLGSGTVFGFQVIPQALYDLGYMNNGLMILPPMALITVACIIWVHRSRNKDLQEK
ncbi:MAG: NADH:ubiquinone reductase (Na(+)-transporting) subunit D [Muribaculaceae bacterium]|nr:NADH:ubiquinone reductase (Na(+)-transporting) subunit D [Muribaculaceae bacterium]MDD6020476.1 NADH:ubiquinone reductase (Na(+)-transporting) subunit D [bacterium]MDD6025984.1 NADH:ubiquinone reductase (Na(+)-transporting) subunit D [bacterium]